MDYGHLPFKAYAIKVRLTTALKLKYGNGQERSHRQKRDLFRRAFWQHYMVLKRPVIYRFE